jgi:hypothetical protein
MSDSHPSLDEQIAALESALKLPLPAETQTKLQQDLARLRAQQVGAAGIQGNADVSGTLHGSAVGVNLGTVQNYYGSQPASSPSGQPPAGITQEQVDGQRRLLVAHRGTLATYQEQLAMHGAAYAPPGVFAGIREARAAIARIKAALRGWGQAVDDYPDDEERS